MVGTMRKVELVRIKRGGYSVLLYVIERYQQLDDAGRRRSIENINCIEKYELRESRSCDCFVITLLS